MFEEISTFVFQNHVDGSKLKQNFVYMNVFDILKYSFYYWILLQSQLELRYANRILWRTSYKEKVAKGQNSWFAFKVELKSLVENVRLSSQMIMILNYDSFDKEGSVIKRKAMMDDDNAVDFMTNHFLAAAIFLP
ncbi:hypothetical protein E5288_WYG012784 [Bos mutus]|uniref:Uncharacterized protein n=1 Tax=Bos mutus TaxID=72004 RepID=A0A6B0QV82_9CETA|nr:hypothetical protein [Bos mutus]